MDNKKDCFNKNKPRDTFKQSYSPSPKKATIDDFLNDDDDNYCDEYLVKLQKDKDKDKDKEGEYSDDYNI